jgi:hypothetical protein
LSTNDRFSDAYRAVGAAMVRQAQDELAEAAQEAEQLDLLEPLTARELEEAREDLGPGAGLVTVMTEAQAKRAGRRKGVRNRRTEDFVKYISQFGQDPAITLMQVQSTPPEELIARSKLLDPEKRRLSYGDAVALRVRCAEALMPFLHAKQPVAVDATIRGVMVVEEIGDARGSVIDLLEAEPLVAPAEEDDEPDE